jgi:alpha-galactosidase
VALWIAPFVATGASAVLREHPELFVTDPESGRPLSSDAVTFGGWRQAPWFVLDGCHPEVQGHLEWLFRELHVRWGIRYFKLDALFWGAVHHGERYGDDCTRIEAYRRGLQAMRRGAPGAYLVGANHPIWPSVGLLEAARVSSDVARDFRVLRVTARESLLRAWQHGVLWHADPDVAVVAEGVGVGAGGRWGGMLPLAEAVFAASVVLAVGGVTLSGDVLESQDGPRLELLRRLIAAPPHALAGGVAWEDDDLQAGAVWWDVGRVDVCERLVGVLDAHVGVRVCGGEQRRLKVLFLLNWLDVPTRVVARALRSCGACTLVDYWAGIPGGGSEDAGGGVYAHEGGVLQWQLQARSARVLLVVEPSAACAD